MISKEEVIKLAKLARLDFSDDELDKIIKDMDDIIAFADTINNSVEGLSLIHISEPTRRS